MFKIRSLFTLALCTGFLTTDVSAFIPFLDEDTKATTVEVGLTGGIFRLSPDFRVYGTQKSAGGPYFDNSVLKVDPRYRLGAGIDIIYGSSYKFNFIYFETSNSRTLTNTGGTIGVSLTPLDWGFKNAQNAFSRLHSRYQFTTISVSNPFTLNCFTATPSLGISYLYLRHNQRTGYVSINTDPNVSALINLESKFRGIGPTFAANFGYEFCGGFSVLANIQYTPLVGDIRGNYLAFSSISQAPDNSNVDLGYKTKSTIVNHTQSEIGFGYAVPINKCFSGNLTLVYRFVKIIGARETNLFVDDVTESTLNNQITNSVLHGPLLRVAIKYKL